MIGQLFGRRVTLGRRPDGVRRPRKPGTGKFPAAPRPLRPGDMLEGQRRLERGQRTSRGAPPGRSPDDHPDATHPGNRPPRRRAARGPRPGPHRGCRGGRPAPGSGAAAAPASEPDSSGGWRPRRPAPDGRRHVVCNADEGEPGTFKDRALLSRRAGPRLRGHDHRRLGHRGHQRCRLPARRVRVPARGARGLPGPSPGRRPARPGHRRAPRGSTSTSTSGSGRGRTCAARRRPCSRALRDAAANRATGSPTRWSGVSTRRPRSSTTSRRSRGSRRSWRAGPTGSPASGRRGRPGPKLL